MRPRSTKLEDQGGARVFVTWGGGFTGAEPLRGLASLSVAGLAWP